MHDDVQHLRYAGHTFVELLIVLGIASVLAAATVACLQGGVGQQRARGAAQAYQAATAWAQSGVLWHAGRINLRYEGSDLQISHDAALCGGPIAGVAPAAVTRANVARWRTGMGLQLTIVGCFATPDSGGSVYFGDNGLQYRVAVRPESGLTARTVAATPGTVP